MGALAKMILGAALMVYPYFVEPSYLLWGIGILLTIALLWWNE